MIEDILTVIQEAKQARAKEEKTIYFVECAGAIKIGITKNLTQRMQMLDTHAPAPVNLLGYLSGDRNKERDFHAMWGKYHIKGEWFMDCLDIRDFIAEVCPWGCYGDESL